MFDFTPDECSDWTGDNAWILRRMKTQQPKHRFVLETSKRTAEPVQGTWGIDCFVVPPGEQLDREKHWKAWFMSLGAEVDRKIGCLVS